jgi:hypothetical protein
MFAYPRAAFWILDKLMMQAAVLAPLFQEMIPINSTPTRRRRTAITTDSSISVVPLWSTYLLVVFS